MGKVFLTFVTIVLFFTSTFAKTIPEVSNDSIVQRNAGISFTENKGQVRDQLNKARPDVLFSGTTGNLSFHFTSRGISHQLIRFQEQIEGELTSIYRVDMNWIDINKDLIVFPGKKLDGYSNYYLDHCPNGINKVQSYESVTYKNIYPGIDAIWYGSKGELKYDYVVAPGARYKQIKMAFAGATDITIDENGELIIATPLGKIIQAAPTAFQSGRRLECYFVLHGNQLSFEVNNYDPSLSLIIDPPTRLWGTYYGGSNTDEGSYCTTDINGNVYLSGSTNGGGTAIATTGSHQQALGGGMYDAFLAKFSPAGVRQWGTYLGGSGNDYGASCACDLFGNVFIGGHSYTSGGSSIATPGSHQSSYGGNRDAFLVKFNTSGVRQWGTYYGGSNGENGNSCSTDAAGNVYLTGYTSSSDPNAIASPGSFQANLSSIDAFLVKFSASGVRQWGTYFGGSNGEVGLGCAIDATGNVCLVGATNSNGTNVATPGSHQQIYGGGNEDGFLAKFSTNGVRLWATYFGGNSSDAFLSCAFDLSGNIFVVGQTLSSNNLAIADPGSHQPTYAGNSDAFLAKFNSSGVKQWSTYYGGTGLGGSSGDFGLCCATDALGNVYISGTTGSGTGTAIATFGSYQPTMNGVNDAFLAKFDTNGIRQWGTYYGGGNVEKGNGCAIDVFGNIYLGCYTGSGTATDVATQGSHQSTFGGVLDAFLVKFDDCNAAAAQPSVISGPTVVCAGIATSYSTPLAYGVNTYTLAMPGGGISLSNTNTISVTPISSGVFTLTASNVCGVSPQQTLYIVVNVSPTVAVNSGTICSGQSFSIISSGGITYTYSSGPVVSPTTTSSYTVVGTNSLGCPNTAVSTVSVYALPVILVNSGSICRGETFTIIASGATNYTYSSGPVVSPTITSSYSVIGMSVEGCVNTIESVSNITVNPLPAISVSSNNTLLCVGESAILTPNGAYTYTFNPGGSGSSHAISPTITSTYTVTGKDVNGCSNTAIVTQSVDACVGINETAIARSKIKLYPNPTKGTITMELDANCEVSITNLLGQLVYYERLALGKHIVTLNKHPLGVYFVSITDYFEQSTIKLIIE